MKRTFRIFLSFGLCAFTLNASALPPIVDQCNGAIDIPDAAQNSVLSTLVPNITDATTTGDPGVPSCQPSVSRSVWFTYTPSVSGPYSFSVCASNTDTTVDDTIIQLYTSTNGCTGPFTAVTNSCDDDFCTVEGLQSLSTANLTAGTKYYIVVWKFGATAPTAGNTAVQVRARSETPPANDACAGAEPIAFASIASGFLKGAALNDLEINSPACFSGVEQTPSTAPGRDIVYSYIPPADGAYTIRTRFAGEGVYSFMSAVTGDCPVGTPGVATSCLGAANRASSGAGEAVSCVNLLKNQKVFYFVDAENESPGPLETEVLPCNLEIEPNNTPDTGNAVVHAVEGAITPANDKDFYVLGNNPVGTRLFAMVDSAFSGSSDTDLRVTTTTDTLEYEDNDLTGRFGGLAPVIAGAILPGVPTYLRVNHFNPANQLQPYFLTVALKPPMDLATGETEPNETYIEANTTPGDYFQGSLATATDKDTFGFTAAKDDFIFVAVDADPLRNNTPIELKVELLDNTNELVFQVNDGNKVSSVLGSPGTLTGTTPHSPAEGLTFRAPKTGRYFVRVSSGGVDSVGDYLLAIDGASTAADPDLDGVPDSLDNCPQTGNPAQEDTDGDGSGDGCDQCANDPAKDKVGLCGCGKTDEDANANELADCFVIAEVNFRLFNILELVGKLKLSDGKFTRKGKKAKKALKPALDELSAYVAAKSIALTLAKPTVNVSELTAALITTIKKARIGKVKSFKKDRNKAIKAIQSLNQTLIT